jgi:hypothetical protein
MLAGHSLGGALAVLAAFHIQDLHRLPHICCYTFGAPRTGNAAFANEYARLVPETFHVINDRLSILGCARLLLLFLFKFSCIETWWRRVVSLLSGLNRNECWMIEFNLVLAVGRVAGGCVGVPVTNRG